MLSGSQTFAYSAYIYIYIYICVCVCVYVCVSISFVCSVCTYIYVSVCLHTWCLKIDAILQNDNSYCNKPFFIWVFKSNHISSKRSKQMTRTEIDWLYPSVHVKYKVLGNVFGGTFSDSFRQNFPLHPHCQDILHSTNFLPDLKFSIFL